jgi:hypothetical protein
VKVHVRAIRNKLRSTPRTQTVAVALLRRGGGAGPRVTAPGRLYSARCLPTRRRAACQNCQLAIPVLGKMRSILFAMSLSLPSCRSPALRRCMKPYSRRSR